MSEPPQPRPNQFKRFRDTLKALVSVPKKEIDERVEEDRQRRQAEQKRS